MESFKKYTARHIIDLLQSKNVTTILDKLMFYNKAHKANRTYQLWQERIAPKLIQSEQMMIEKINYIYNNPVKRGYVDEPYAGDTAMLGIMQIKRD